MLISNSSTAEMVCSPAGFVRTDMTRHSGLIDVDQAVEGMISVLESDLPLNGHWCVFIKLFRPLPIIPASRYTDCFALAGMTTSMRRSHGRKEQLRAQPMSCAPSMSIRKLLLWIEGALHIKSMVTLYRQPVP